MCELKLLDQQVHDLGLLCVVRVIRVKGPRQFSYQGVCNILETIPYIMVWIFF